MTARTWLIVGAVASLLIWERRRPLRDRVAPTAPRALANALIAAGSAATIQLGEQPVARALAHCVETRRWGLVQRLPIPHPVRTLLACLLLDYTLYIWHVLTHRLPILWRLHRLHHADRDLDVLTALRFHAAEMALSIGWRGAQIVGIGVTPPILHIWQTATLLSVLFHHSNVRLPLRWEIRLSRFVVTPRMHGIHHSVLPEHRHANWSSGLTLWDRLHGTLKLDVPQEAMTIGVQDEEIRHGSRHDESRVGPLRPVRRSALALGCAP